VPVGTYIVRASDGRNAIGQATGVIPTAGAEARTNVVVIPNQPLGTLTGRVFRSDGSTPAGGFLVYVGSLSFAGGKPVIRAVDQGVTDAAGSFAFTQLLANTYDVVAVDPATRQLGKTRTEVIAQVTNATSVVMEAFGSVEGVVRDAQGQPVAGARIAGGTALVETDANGFFHVDGVTAGTISIEAGNPQNKRRGSATVTVLPGQTVTAAVTLEARATIVGRVLDANGQPVPDVTVRLPQDGGYTFVFANHNGVFRLPNLPLGSYLIQAPGPPLAALIDYMKSHGIDPCSAFTAGEPPPDLHCGTDPFAGVDLNDTNAVLEVYKNAVETFIGLNDPQFVGFPEPPAGGFGWTKVQLLQDSVTGPPATIQYLPQGTVSGMTVDSNSLPTGAVVRIKGVTFGKKGEPLFQELQRVNTNPQDGVFSLSGIPLFDLATFQATGIPQLGDFTLQAAAPFSPAIVQFNGQLNANTPNAAGIVLRFPAATDTNGTISGIVFMPDGTTPSSEGTQVQISFGDLTVTTDAQGRFVSHLPIPADSYTVTAEEPISGLRGQAYARVITGENVDVQVRLLGLGAITLTVQRPNGQVVPNTNVELIRGGFPGDRANGVTSTNGTVQFVNITEGPFSITAES